MSLSLQPDPFSIEWRQAAKVLPANFLGLQTFRQFRLQCTREPYFIDDFTLHSLSGRQAWRPRDNTAFCDAGGPPHMVADVCCSCGFYGSYSSSIIYLPRMLSNPMYCFAAVRQYGEYCTLAQNGLRSAGADVDGVLFNPRSLKLPAVQSFIRRLNSEGIFHTGSAIEFILKFPDQDYSALLGFDPIKRLAEKRQIIFESRQFVGLPNHWTNRDYTNIFCRPVQHYMLDHKTLDRDPLAINSAFAISIKPEHRPGGSLYKHPLLEVWSS